MADYTLHMEETFEVDRKIEDCFTYITDFSLIKEWDHTVVDSYKTSNGAIELGTTFDVILKFGIQKSKMDYKITEYNFPNQAVLIGEASGFTAVDTVLLESINSTKTKVTWKAAVTFKGSRAKFMPYIENTIKKSGTKTIVGLKEALQNNYEPPSISAGLKLADSLIFPGMFMFTKFGYRFTKDQRNPISNSIVGKHIVLTGATSGLGLSAAQDLAHRGAHLTLVARNKIKAEKVIAELTQQTGNENITLEIADMSLMKDVQALSDRLKNKHKSIDVLINNAGALFNERKLTHEGIERSFALLLLAPYLLTKNLLPLLSKSEDARVINISSGGMYSQKLKVNDLEFKKGKYEGSLAYARAKRGLMIITEQLAEEHSDSNIVFNAMHPGWADTPGVEDSLPGFYKITKPILRTPAEGADTIVWMAAASEANQLNGKFLLDRIPHKTHLMAKTKASNDDRLMLRGKLDEYVNQHVMVAQ